MTRSKEQQVVLRLAGVHLGAGRVDVHVDLAPHPEATGQIHARLDREPDAGHERARVFGFEVVDVRARPVQIAVDGVARTMDEVVAQPRIADHGARGVLDTGAGESGAVALEVYGRVPRSLHRLPHPAHVRIW